ncbi:MAG: TlpA disulfide reductase family protein [candidate division NC10 bacterium]|nr:TlpA disulfide reductase family protein [candidate division NC10 bacterium]
MLLHLASMPSAHATDSQFKKAPAFSAQDVEGKLRALADFLGAKPILLEFMEPTCPHCRDMAPILTRLQAAYGERVQFLTMAFDKNVQRIQGFVAREKHAWPYLVGSQDIVNAYRLEGVPTFYFLIPDGTMIDVVVGSLPEDALRQNLENLLKAK